MPDADVAVLTVLVPVTRIGTNHTREHLYCKTSLRLIKNICCETALGNCLVLEGLGIPIPRWECYIASILVDKTVNKSLRTANGHIVQFYRDQNEIMFS